MMAPVYISGGAAALSEVLLSVTLLPLFIGVSLTGLEPVALVQQLYMAQAAASLGLMGGAALVLSALYLFYLWLGRWFSRVSMREV
jgi:hypothetical protein